MDEAAPARQAQARDLVTRAVEDVVADVGARMIGIGDRRADSGNCAVNLLQGQRRPIGVWAVGGNGARPAIRLQRYLRAAHR